jgi:hypothetical protein
MPVAGPWSSAHSRKASQATQKAASSSLLTPQLEQSFTISDPDNLFISMRADRAVRHHCVSPSPTATPFRAGR